MVIKKDLVDDKDYSKKPTEKKIEYPVYTIFYKDTLNNNTIASVAAKNGNEAIGLLEKAINKLGYKNPVHKDDLNAITEETKFKTSKKGVISGYDSLMREFL